MGNSPSGSCYSFAFRLRSFRCRLRYGDVLHPSHDPTLELQALQPVFITVCTSSNNVVFLSQCRTLHKTLSLFDRGAQGYKPSTGGSKGLFFFFLARREVKTKEGCYQRVRAKRATYGHVIYLVIAVNYKWWDTGV